MQHDQATKQTMYLGRAAEDLTLTGTELKVIIPELTPSALSGTFAAGTTESKVELKNLTGGTITASPTSANHIIAVWEGTSNMAYPPSIKKGEMVEVIKYGDSDRYYWNEKGRDRNLRQLDRFRLETSASPNLNEAKNDSNTYFIELNGISGSFTIKTSKANGEPFAYVIQIDAKKGTVLISDDAGDTPNRIFLDSGANGGTPCVQLNNSKNSTISLLGEDIIISAPRDIMLNAARQIVSTTAVATLNWDIGVIKGTTLGIESSESVVVKSPTVCFLGNTKTVGWAIATTMRAEAYYTGALNWHVKMPVTDPATGEGTVGHNTPDTSLPEHQRHAAAFEDMVAMAGVTTEWFRQVREHIGVPVADETLTIIATRSEMHYNAGT